MAEWREQRSLRFRKGHRYTLRFSSYSHLVVPTVLFATAALIVFFMRLPHHHAILIDWDEASYFTVAWDLATGGVPYKTAWDHKGPWLYLMLAPVAWLFPADITPMRVFTTFCVIASMYFLYLAARRFTYAAIAVLVSLFYGCMMSWDGCGLASNAEVFMALPLTAATWLAIRFHESPKGSRLLGVGALTAAGGLIKLTVLFSFIGLLPILIWANDSWRPVAFREICRRFIVFTVGAALVVLPTLIYFYINDATAVFYDSYIDFNLRYTTFVPFIGKIQNSLNLMLGRWEQDPFTKIFLLALASACLSVVAFWSRSNQRRTMVFTILVFLFMLASSLVGLTSTGRAFPHYYLQMAVPFAMIVGIAVHLILARIERFQVVFIPILAAFLIHQSPVQRLRESRGKQAHIHGKDEYALARLIKSETTPDQTILQIGGPTPILNFLSERKPPTEFFFWLHFEGFHGDLLQIGQRMMPRLIRQPPELIIWPSSDRKSPLLWPFIEMFYARQEIFTGWEIYRLKAR